MAGVPEAYNRLIEHVRQTAVLESCLNLLGWDEQTYMPRGGAEFRAQQSGLLAGLIHERRTAPVVGEWLAELESADLGDPDGPVAVNVREIAWEYHRAIRLPRDLVEEISRTTSQAQHAWVEARQKSDFALFRPWLEKVVRLKREEAQALGPESGNLYDALLESYEPGARSAEIAALFAPLREELVRLARAIADSGREAPTHVLKRRFPISNQERFAWMALEAIGFDLERGRLDVSPHPFCSGIGPGDCRLTTRYREDYFPSAFFGVLHEGGHGLYEQGLDPAYFGTPMGDAVSLGIHESQSRLWENMVGRSLAFWKRFFPLAQEMFPEALKDVSVEQFHWAVNDVRPSLIRVEADEVTYNLHIMVRFELEPALLTGDLPVDEVPGAWNARYREYLGVEPSNDAEGCLQDIHWSAGLIGYFPTYTLGNVFAAQFLEAARAELGDLDAMFAAGEFRPLLDWLRRNIHRRGRQYRSNRLVEVVTGKPPDPSALIRYLNDKYTALYGL